MRHVLLVAAVAATALAVSVVAATASTWTETSTIGINLCPSTTSTWYPQPPADSPGGYGCSAMTATATNSSPASPVDLGTFCSTQNPIGAWVHVSGQNGEGVPGAAVSVTVGSTTATSATGPGAVVDFPVGTFAPGTYAVVAVFPGATGVPMGPDTVDYTGSAAYGTVTIAYCPPPLPVRPGCGAGDANHVHTGPPNTEYAFADDTCPSQARHGK